MPSSPEFSDASAPITPPPPGQNAIAWAMQNPDALHKLIEMHNQLKNLEIAVVQNGVTTRFPLLRPAGGRNAIIELQLPSTL